MKVAFVTPRYGDEVVGGAELGALQVAERLAARPGWEVEAITTCALDAQTWANAYDDGTVQLRGVNVRRFANDARRHPEFERLSQRILRKPEDAKLDDEQRWVDWQGPVSGGLLDAVRSSDADVLVFKPYLYHPTVRGVSEVSERAVLYAAAHDEPQLRLPLFQDVFAAARGLVFNTHAERRLVSAGFPVAHVAQAVIGLGSEPGAGDPITARDAVGLGDRPYMLCLGRVDDGKGARLLSRFFAAYKERRPGDLELVFAGPVVDDPGSGPDVVVTGPVDEATKWGLLRGATALVSPSAYESFALVLLEAWDAGIPVLVNARCSATREQAERSAGGLWFGDYETFEICVDRLTGSASLRDELAGNGEEFVESTYRWPVVADRYATFLEQIAAHP